MSTERPRRRPRAGADAAHAWVRSFALGDPCAKSILLALCNYVNDQGIATAGISTLALDTEYSDNTIRRRLVWLETIGAIARIPRFRDEHGRINYEGRGKRTSDEIKLLLDADPEEIETAAAASRNSAATVETEAASPPTQGMQSDTSEEVSPPTALPQPSHTVGGPKTLSKWELGESPQSPPCTEKPKESGLAKKEESDLALSQFKATYPIPTNRPEQLASAWSRLNPEDRRKCQRGAEGARKLRETNPKRPPPIVDPCKFVASPALWAEYVRYAPPEPPRYVKLKPGSDEQLAAAVIAAVAGRKVLTELREPIPEGAAALARFANSDGLGRPIDYASWLVVERDDPRCVAWQNRVKEWLHVWIEPDRIFLDEYGRRVRHANEAATAVWAAGTAWERTVPKSTVGLVVPCEWPPAKGVRDPPHQADSLATEEDWRELAKGFP